MAHTLLVPEETQARLAGYLAALCAGKESLGRFNTCSAMGMDLDGLLRFLEGKDKVRITSGVVFPGGAPACEH